MDRFLGSFFVIICFITLSNALECYVCDTQEDNKQKCLESIRTCEQDEDACMTEVNWGSTLYWSSGAKKQYYISKKCAKQHECENLRNKHMRDCTYLWYEDWRCSDCCKGDRCNYFIISSGNKFSISVIMTLSVTLITIFGTWYQLH